MVFMAKHRHQSICKPALKLIEEKNNVKSFFWTPEEQRKDLDYIFNF